MITVTPEYLKEQGLSADFPQRFWTKVWKTETCWIWVGAGNGHSYGGLRAGACGTGIRTPIIRAHIASWILHFGPVPEGKHICHRCDQPRCIRPDHLWPGTHDENMRDKALKERGPRKISMVDVQEIRRLYAEGEVTQLTLANLYHLTPSMICMIISRKRRNHVS
jgi:hypothetical protein